MVGSERSSPPRATRWRSSRSTRCRCGVPVAKVAFASSTRPSRSRCAWRRSKPPTDGPGTVILPHGLGGKAKTVLVVDPREAEGAQEAGADTWAATTWWTGSRRRTGWPSTHGGHAGHMSRWESGEISAPAADAEPEDGHRHLRRGQGGAEIKAGKVEYRVTRPRSSTPPTARSRRADKLLENARALIDSVLKARPPGGQGKYVKSIALSSTMGPGVRVDLTPWKPSVGTIMHRRRSRRSSRPAQGVRQSQHAILVDFRGLSVPAVTEFRRRCAVRLALRVVKNTSPCAR